jgi:hypothetical protein
MRANKKFGKLRSRVVFVEREREGREKEKRYWGRILKIRVRSSLSAWARSRAGVLTKSLGENFQRVRVRGVAAPMASWPYFSRRRSMPR